jgi:hypothetical protein
VSSHYLSSHYGPSHYLSSHYGRGIIIPPIVPPFTPDPTFPPGTRRYDEMARWIEAEDELLMLVIRAFLTMKDRE